MFCSFIVVFYSEYLFFNSSTLFFVSRTTDAVTLYQGNSKLKSGANGAQPCRLSENKRSPSNVSPSTSRIDESFLNRDPVDDDGTNKSNVGAMETNYNWAADITEHQVKKWEKLCRFLQKHGSFEVTTTISIS